jgi:hypothetical protein
MAGAHPPVQRGEAASRNDASSDLTGKEAVIISCTMLSRPCTQREANDVLAIWTARVVEIKVRELTVTDEYARRLKR